MALFVLVAEPPISKMARCHGTTAPPFSVLVELAVNLAASMQSINEVQWLSREYWIAGYDTLPEPQLINVLPWTVPWDG
jgi:hypothetical protein